MLFLIYSGHVLILWNYWICFIWSLCLNLCTKPTGTISHYLRLLVLSTKLTFSIRFAYLEHEREENSTWALEKFKELSTSEKLLSKVMVTNRKLDLMNVIEIVFHPHSTSYVYSMFQKNVGLKWKEYVEANRQEHVMNLWNKVMYLNMVFEFEQHLQHFEVVPIRTSRLSPISAITHTSLSARTNTSVPTWIGTSGSTLSFTVTFGSSSWCLNQPTLPPLRSRVRGP